MDPIETFCKNLFGTGYILKRNVPVIPYGRIKECYTNCKEYVQKYNQYKMIVGWIIMDNGGCSITAIHHAILGKLTYIDDVNIKTQYIDITPGLSKTIDFVVDSSIYLRFINEDLKNIGWVTTTHILNLTFTINLYDLINMIKKYNKPFSFIQEDRKIYRTIAADVKITYETYQELLLKNPENRNMINKQWEMQGKVCGESIYEFIKEI